MKREKKDMRDKEIDERERLYYDISSRRETKRRNENAAESGIQIMDRDDIYIKEYENRDCC